MTRILVSGAAGMLGREIVDAAVARGQDVFAHDRDTLDITDADATAALVSALRPDAIFNSAAFTAVDDCESQPDLAFRINRDGPANLAAAARTVGARLVHVSTDYVFDGTKPTPYLESDAPNPQSVYGASKLAGEAAVLDTLGDRAIVARAAWMFGRHGSNIVKTVLRLTDEAAPLRFVDDQRGSPTAAADLAEKLLDLATADVHGVVHVTNQGAVSWYEFVREILARCGDDPDRVVAIRTADLDPPRPAPRPANSVLDNAVLRAAGIALLPDFRDALDRCLASLRSR